jgi:hypothetical protein
MTIDTTSIVISLVSLIVGAALSVIAIWLSIHFFTKSKESETETASLLTQIKEQTSQLANINDKLFGRALNALSHIAKEKTTSGSDAEQIAAAVHSKVKALIPEPQTVAGESVLEGPRSQDDTWGYEDQGNSIAQHHLPGLPDPLTLADLNKRYFQTLVVQFNLYGWANNYAQQALFVFTDPVLVNETINNLNQSAAWYRMFEQEIERLKAEKSDVVSSLPAAAQQYEATKARLKGLIRDHTEYLKFQADVERRMREAETGES